MDFFQNQTIKVKAPPPPGSLTARAASRTKKVSAIGKIDKGQVVAEKKPVKSLRENVLSKEVDGICTACTYCGKKLKSTEPPSSDPAYNKDHHIIFAERVRKGIGNINSGIYILTETLDKKAELLMTYLQKVHGLTTNDYYLRGALECLPMEGKKENEAVAPYVACNILHTEPELLEVKPKVILTFGKALYSITHSGDALSRAKIAYSRVYSMKYDCNIFPCPDLNYMLEKKNDGKYYFQDNWYRYKLDQNLKSAINGDYPKFPKVETVNSFPDSEDEAAEAITSIINAQTEYFVYDLETSGFDWFDGDFIDGIALATDPVKAYYIEWKFIDDRNKQLLNNLFDKKSSIAHNGKFDEKFLIKYGVSSAKTDDDTMLMHHLLRADCQQGLKPLAYLYTQYGGYDEKLDQHMKDNGIKRYSDVDREILGWYACMDVRVTCILYFNFLRKLSAKEAVGQKWIYENISIPLARIFRKGEMKGMRIDQDYLDNYSLEMINKRDAAEKAVYDIVGSVFNINSSKEVIEVVKQLNLPVTKKTKSGGISTDQEAMEGWKKQGSEFATKYLEHAAINTQINSFIGEKEKKNGLYQHIKSDGRVHGNFLVHGTETGRLSSKEPNLQNQPKDKIYRRIYQCPPGYSFIEADFSQAELRVAAVLSDDKAMKGAFQNDQDIHCTTVCSMTGMPYEEVVRLKDAGDEKVGKLRKKAKTVNFGVIYGESAFSLAESLGITLEEAEEFLKDYFRGFSGLDKWRHSTQAFTKKYGMTRTLWGRVRKFNELEYQKGLSMSKLSGFMRQAMNSPVHGTASDYTLYSLVKVAEYLEKNNFESMVTAMVHDSVVLEAKNEEIPIIAPKIKEIMETCADVGVKMEADIEIGSVWGFPEVSMQDVVADPSILNK